MERIYKESILLRTCNCDLMGAWRPGQILEMMQETAGTHGEMIGFGRKVLLEKNLIWVISRLEVEMDRYPTIGETITVETFPMAVRRWFFPRYYLFRDVHGREIGRAGSLWLLMDLATRRMAPPATVANLLPDNSDLLAPLGLPATVGDIEGSISLGSYTPVYTDMDVNMHVNNTRYIDWCCNALGVDTMRNYQLSRFAVNYNAEIREGQSVQTRLCRLNNEFSFSGSENDVRHFIIGGTLTERALHLEQK